MAFVAMHELDFGEVKAQAGAILEGVERAAGFGGLFSSKAIVADNDPCAAPSNGQRFRFGELGEVLAEEEAESRGSRKRR